MYSSTRGGGHDWNSTNSYAETNSSRSSDEGESDN